MSINLYPNEDYDENSPRDYREPLKAEGNLNYLEFIKLVQILWNERSPDIPIVATKTKNFAKYPCIVYGLEIRTTHQEEMKPHHRQTIKFKDGGALIIHGQRFINIISFSVLTENQPELADEIIESFELFMMEYTPIFKRMGASEFMYSRRLPDSEESRKNEDVCRRTVTYRLVTEVLMQVSHERIESILIDVRRKLTSALQEEEYIQQATPTVNIIDLYGQATPSD